MTVTEFAPAKLNLALHITGLREDSYHSLDSLVAFANIGDYLLLETGQLSLKVDGPFANKLSSQKNLCLEAARLIGHDAGIRLIKNLPVASGIGGGSADAAAVLRGCIRLGAQPPDKPEQLGADVPVCFAGHPVRMRGIGECLEPLPPLPDFHLVLINPGVGLSTPDVFRHLTDKENSGLPELPEYWDFEGLISYLMSCRNDLQESAIELCPQILTVLRELESGGALLARMSGSGATCFGIFDSAHTAGIAAYRIGAAHENWWVVSTGLATVPLQD